MFLFSRVQCPNLPGYPSIHEVLAREGQVEIQIVEREPVVIKLTTFHLLSVTLATTLFLQGMYRFCDNIVRYAYRAQ